MKTSLNPSLWEGELLNLEASPLMRDATADVCVIGAGIAGLTTAYLLAKQGRRVVVLDAGSVGGGETKHSTAHLSNAIDGRYHEMIRIHGEFGARLIAESHSAAIDRIEEIVRNERIACEFSRLDGYLFLAPGGRETELMDELLAVHRVGLRRVERLDRAPEGSFDTGPCLQFPGQGQIHPLKYLAGLCSAFQRYGGHIWGGTQVKSVRGGTQSEVETSRGFSVKAAHIVVATNTPINDIFAMHSKQAAYRSYALAAEIPEGSVRKALYWDTLDPYHYVRTEAGHGGLDYLIVGGEDHKTGQANDAAERFFRLEQWVRERFPRILGISHRWSGQVMETIDGIAFIGRNPMDKENVWIATGDCGMGMTHGTIAGMLLSDLILGRENRWAELYEPTRKRAGALGEFARENLNVAARYTDYVSRGDVESASEVLPGTGGVTRDGLKKVALYRDETGQLHSFSAVCPHLKCILHWNSLEKTWDCPCHGSRFSAIGEVLNGPATSNMVALGTYQQTESVGRK